MNCPLCGHELLAVGGGPSKETTTLRCNNHGGCTASQETWEKMQKLADFTRYCIEEYCWDCLQEPDGGDLQEKAEKLGLIHAVTATKADVDPEFDDYEVGDTIYKFTFLGSPR